MGKPEHPSQETEAEQAEAYKELRKNIARQIRLHGVPLILIPLTERRVTGTGRHFVNPRRDQTFSLNRTHTEFQEPLLVLSMHKIYETDTLEETQYISSGRGPFRRNDFSGDAGDISTPEARTEHDAKMAQHIEANLEAEASGLTGQPITAEEARDLIDLVAGAEPLPDFLGRTPTSWA